MLTKKNIFSPLKIGFIGLLFVLSNYAFAATYYVDATKGSDEYNGLSPEHALKTLNKVRSTLPSLSAGDQVLFKRDEIFNGYIGLKNISGSSSNPITIGAYGTGARPILRDIWNGRLRWISAGSGNYYALIGQKYASRLLMDSKEILRSAENEVVDGSQFVWKGGSTVTINLTHYPVSDKNPNNHTFQYAKENEANNDAVLNISNSHYLNIQDIALEGGFQYGVFITNGSSYINIKNVETGKHGRIGIKMFGNPHHILVDRCIVDSHFTLDYATNEQYDGHGGTNIGPIEGILIHHQAHDVEIKNTLVKNFGHANIQLFADATEPGSKIYNVNIHHNTITAPDLAYGGRVTFDGNIENCELSYNLIFDTAVRSQLNGHNNHYHHNIFDTIKNSVLKSYKTGQGFLISNYSDLDSTNNIYENNLIINSGSYGILDGATKNNTYRNNIIYVGHYKGMSIEGSGSNNYNTTVQNNLFYSANAETKIRYRDKSFISISSFNNQNGYKGDAISGNMFADPMFLNVSGRDYRLQSNSPAIGKGPYPSPSDTHTIGAPLSSEEPIYSEKPSEEPFGAFVMIPGGQLM